MAVNGTVSDVGRQGDGPASIVAGAGITEQDVGRPGAIPVTGGPATASSSKEPTQNVARGDLPKVGGNVAN